MRKFSKNSLAKAIKRQKDAIAKHRDALRDIEADAQQIADDCDHTIACLEYAIATLSEQQ